MHLTRGAPDDAPPRPERSGRRAPSHPGNSESQTCRGSLWLRQVPTWLGSRVRPRRHSREHDASVWLEPDLPRGARGVAWLTDVLLDGEHPFT